ncbi:hypothetical protein V6N12_016118 [Hibiscus sabdariffa]|uniref:Uncharacterized protein n=1 Tax=Hibiscus sabdariffa TaxID=183260 RepID=A0ABR2C8R9_9ROSI
MIKQPLSVCTLDEHLYKNGKENKVFAQILNKMQVVQVMKEISEVKISIVRGRGAHAIKSDILFELGNLCRNMRKSSDEMFARVNGALSTDRDLVHLGEWVGEYIPHRVLVTSFDLRGSETTSIFIDALDTGQISTRASSSGERSLKLTSVFQRYLHSEKDYLSISLIYNNEKGSLDLIYKEKVEQMSNMIVRSGKNV